MNANEIFERGVAQFNARKFFEAHEAWEELWLIEPEPEKTFLQGLIQVAAALHHHSRGNSRGAKSLLAAGIVKLACFPASHRGLAVAKLRTQAKRWLRWLDGEEGTGPPPPPKITVPEPQGRSKARSRRNATQKRARHR